MANIKFFFICTVALSLGLAVSAHVEELDETFMEKNADEIWLITFYSPKCAFCKSLEPVMQQVEAELRRMGSLVHVGQVDATAHTSIAKEFRVPGYPTIKMLKENAKYSYQGPRTKDAIIDFAIRVSGPAVRALPSQQMFHHVMARHDVLFLYVGGASNLKRDYIFSARQLIVHTYFFSATRDILPETVTIQHLPAVMVVKDGSHLVYNEEQDGDLTSWINRERFLNYLKLDSYTLYAMGESGKLVVLAVVDDNNRTEDSLRCRMLVESVATEYKEQYSREIHFGRMEGNEYIDGIIMGKVVVPSIMVLNLSNDGYFLPPDPVETQAQLLRFIDGVLNGTIESLGGNELPQQISRLMYRANRTVMTIYTEAPAAGFVLLLALVLCVGGATFLLRRVLTLPVEEQRRPGAVGQRRAGPRQQRKQLADKKKD